MKFSMPTAEKMHSAVLEGWDMMNCTSSHHVECHYRSRCNIELVALSV